jgi:hypothetical protein
VEVEECLYGGVCVIAQDHRSFKNQWVSLKQLDSKSEVARAAGDCDYNYDAPNAPYFQAELFKRPLLAIWLLFSTVSGHCG